jgi:hypothetical protein
VSPGYIVAVIPPKDATPAQAETLWRLAHATFTRAMHERIATSVVTTYETELRSTYVEKGGDPEKWPEALGGGFEPEWKVPYANAIVFGEKRVNKEQARMVREAIDAQRMLAVVSREGPLKRVTGLAGGYLQTG